MAAQRYRISAWTDNDPADVRRTWSSKKCRACLIREARAWAWAIGQIKSLPHGPMHWTVGRLTGHMGSYEVILHDRMNIGDVRCQHAR